MKNFLLLSSLAVSTVAMMAQEVTTFDATIGEMTTPVRCNNQKMTPISPYYQKNQTKMIWTAEELSEAGIEVGTMIKGATFYGSTLEVNKNMDFDMTVYMGTTTLDVANKDIEVPTEVFPTANYVMPVLSGSTEEGEPMIVVNFATPYEYTGDNLIMQMNRTSSQWSGEIYFVGRTTGLNRAVMRQVDSGLIENSAWSNPDLFATVTFSCEKTVTGVKTLAADAPAVRVIGNTINVDTESAISVFASNGTTVARVNGTRLDVNNLPAGVYIVNVRNDEGISTRRFVKK